MRLFLVLAVVLLGGTALQKLYHVDQPWLNGVYRQGLKGSGGGLYSNAGRNHLRYGYVATRGAMISCAGRT